MLSPYINLFQKIKRGLELISLPQFLHNFWRKLFLFLYSINWPNFIVWLSLLCEILGNMFIKIVYKPGCDVINFAVNLISLIKPFFPTWAKSPGKNYNIFRTKITFKVPLFFKTPSILQLSLFMEKTRG